MSVGGRELIGSRCHRRPELDPGVDGAVFDGGPGGLRLTPGRTVEVRIHVSPDSRHTGTVSTDPRAVLGLYAQEGPSHRVLGADLLDHSESDGHDWLAGRWLESRPGSTSLRLHLPAADRPRLLTWVADEAPGGRSRVVFKLSHGDGARGTIDEQDMSTVGGRSSGSGYVVQPGRPTDVLLAVPHGTNRTRLALVVSDQLE